jgi:hypothetical protein
MKDEYERRRLMNNSLFLRTDYFIYYMFIIKSLKFEIKKYETLNFQYFSTDVKKNYEEHYQIIKLIDLETFII